MARLDYYTRCLFHKRQVSTTTTTDVERSLRVMTGGEKSKKRKPKGGMGPYQQNSDGTVVMPTSHHFYNLIFPSHVSIDSANKTALVEWSPSLRLSLDKQDDGNGNTINKNEVPSPLQSQQCSSSSSCYSYAWLEDTSRVIAQRLETFIIAKQPTNASDHHGSTTIGLLSRRETATVSLIVHMLAAMRLNRSFVFLVDDRKEEGEEDSLPLLPAPLNCRVVVDCSGGSLRHTNISSDSNSGMKVVTETSIQNTAHQEQNTEFGVESKNGVLYYLSTSGSTGEPRWVAGTVAGTWNRISWQLERSCSCPSLGNQNANDKHNDNDDFHIAKTALRFVDCIAEMLVPLVSRSTLVVVQDVDNDSNSNSNNNNNTNPWRDPGTLLRVCQDCNVTHLVATPSMLRELVLELPLLVPNQLLSLRCIHSSGEALSTSLARRLLHELDQSVTLWNLYGSTEVSADVTAQQIDKVNVSLDGSDVDDEGQASRYQPVGQPLPGCQILLLQERSVNAVATNKTTLLEESTEEGEIFVLGSHVAKGYMNSNDSDTGRLGRAGFGWLYLSERNIDTKCQHTRTIYRFSPDSPSRHDHSNPRWCFRTGDIGRWKPYDVGGSSSNNNGHHISEQQRYEGKMNRSLYIMGRADQMVKLNGKKVSLLQVEATMKDKCQLDAIALVLNHDDAEDTRQGQEHTRSILVALAARSRSHNAKNCSIDTGEGGQCRCSYTQINANRNQDGNDKIWSCFNCEALFRQELRQRLPNATSVPQRIIFTSALPRNGNDKVDRRRARDFMLSSMLSLRTSKGIKLQDDDTGVGDPMAEKDEIAALEKTILEYPTSQKAWLFWFTRQFTFLLAGSEIREDDNLLEHGCTSMTLIQVITKTRNLVAQISACKGPNLSQNINFLYQFEQNETPRLLANLLVSIVTTGSHANTEEVAKTPFVPGSLKVTHLDSTDLNECSKIVSEVFCHHEPLTQAFLLDNSTARLKRYSTQVRLTWKHLLKDNFCFIAKDALLPGKGGKSIVAFALGNVVRHYPASGAPGDFFRQMYCPLSFSNSFSRLLRCCGFAGIELPELKPLEEIFSEVTYRWAEWLDLDFTKGDVVQMSISGATKAVSTPQNALYASIVGLCESKILEEAKRRSFSFIYTICTNDVTRFIARENGMRSRIRLDTVTLLQEMDLDVPQATLNKLPKDHKTELFDSRCGKPRYDCMENLFNYGLKVDTLALNSDVRVAATVEKLVEQAFRYYREADITRELSYVREHKGNALVLQDVNGQKMIACAVYDTHQYESEGRRETELLLLAVQPQHRGLGGSTLLLSRLIDLGRAQKWDSIFLVASEHVKDIYTSKGFREMDVTNTSSHDELPHTENRGRRISKLCLDLKNDDVG